MDQPHYYYCYPSPSHSACSDYVVDDLVPLMTSFPTPGALSMPTLLVPASAPPPASVADHGTPMSTPDRSPPPPPALPATVTTACLACRAKHLKCDGRSPCGRCLGTQSPCIYVASRRGYKGPRCGGKRPASQSPSPLSQSQPPSPLYHYILPVAAASAAASAVGAAIPPPPPPPPAAPAVFSPAAAAMPPRPGSGGGIHNFSTNELYSAGMDLLSPPPPSYPPSAPSRSLFDRCIDAFYRNFHPAHPFVLPKPFLLQAARDTDLRHLFAAICWVGSLYLVDMRPAGAGAGDIFLDEARRLTREAAISEDGFLVQTLLLLAIGLDASGRQDEARARLADAERIAVEIGLDPGPSGILGGAGSCSPALFEESWRRTWWDLFVVGGSLMTAAPLGAPAGEGGDGRQVSSGGVDDWSHF